MYTKGGAAVGAAGVAAATLPLTGIGYAVWLLLAFVLLVAGLAALRTARNASWPRGDHTK
jgi:hypothetical protein